MKLRLPHLLRRLLISAMTVTGVTVGTSNSDASIMNSDVSLVTYADFGQNLGWYKTDSDANALLTYLRQQQGGVTISYLGGQETYTLPHEMGNFTGATDNGAFMALGYNATASVQHNGVFAGSFTTQYVGNGNAIYYQGIEYRIDNSETFLHSPKGGYDGRGNGGFDHKVTRMSKLITDVEGATLFSGTSDEMRNYVSGELVYHVGAGTMQMYDAETGKQSGLLGAYHYIVGGIETATHTQSHNGGDITYISFSKEGHESITTADPLPFAGQQGDSGSPMFVYNENTGQYEYIGAVAYIGGNQTQLWGAIDYVRSALTQYDKLVHTTDGASELRIGAVNTAGETITADNAAYNYGMNREVSTTPYSGKVTGNGIDVDFVGVRTGINTWKDLSFLCDTNNWYSYNNDYLNAAPHIEGAHATAGKQLTYADLFVTENLVFAAGTAQTNIVLDATVDLGIGYAQFSLGGTEENPVTNARFDISASGNYQFNHAGYVIDQGVDVYTTLTGHQTLINAEGISSSYMFEWRKLGAGNLHIEGSGNNDIFLNVGGAGKTYLNRTNGYAAYNVLANTHTTVVINDIGQIYRDFTFGHQGGVLDMNGNSMVWNNANTAEADGFTIHALDDLAIVANLKSDSTTTLTWTQGGAQTFLGSFADNGKDSALKFVYNGGEGASLTLNSIKTHLTNANSGMEVQSGTLTLVGTNTVHGKGSLTGTNANRYHSDLDWHYADATSNVTVAGGTFELGSHARLTGNVTVQDGGTFLMREGVQHAQEYIEGSTVLMNTSAINKFYGLKGNIFLEDGGTMRVEYNEGVTVNNTYAGNISGSGAVVIDLGATDAMFTLAGRNTFTGSKTLEEGILVATNVSALGNVGESRWLLGANGTLQVASGLTAGNALSLIDGNSTGTLALMEDMAGVLDMSQSHANLFVGAEMGKKVQYGTANDTLNATSKNKWNLGGGGGELVVNAALTGGGTLVLGNGQGLGGIVTLTNTGNSIGSITFNPGVTLSFDSAGALGGATIDLTYGSSLLGSADAEALLPLVTATSTGSILLDRANNADFDLSAHQVALGSKGDVTYEGNVTVAENAAYRFGGGTGTLTLAQVLAVNGTTNNLEIDGQGHSGSKVILGAATGITGQVTVQGSAQGTGGDITLGFTTDNALASTSRTLIEAGGIVDLGATTQTFTNMQVKEGGLLMGGEGSTVVFNMTSELAQYGSMQLDQAEKTGAANMILAGADNAWNLFTIKEGTVYTRVDNALSATGITRVENGATLDLNAASSARTMQGNVVLADATLTAGGDAHIITFDGTIAAAAGMTGTITGGAEWVLNSSENNRNGGTLLFNASRLELNQGYEQYIGGTFVVGANTLALHSDGATENMLKHFNSLNLAAGKTLNITERTWNTIWQLDELTGAGTINWDSTTTHSKTARLMLGGEGKFSGTINMLRRYADGGRTHQAYIEINGENAVSGATLNFSGTGGNSQASLAINADNVNVGGLQSNVSIGSNSGAHFAHIFAGAAPDDAASSTGHASTRKATLTLTGTNTYTYTGNVGTTSDTLEKSLNVTMAGAGTQSFECGTFVVGDLTAKSGNLRVLKTADTTFSVLGDVNLYQGATLSLVDNAGGNASYTLGTGSSINICDVADLDASVSANFNTDLVLAGGTINFDAAALATGGSSAMLDLSSVQAGAVNISFSNTGHLGVGEYYLISGDWSALANQTSQITLAGLPHMTGTFVADSSGLKLTLTKNADSRIWVSLSANGTENDWGEFKFGGGSMEWEPVTGTAVFDDSAGYSVVEVTHNQNVENLVFNASEKDYTLDASAQSVTAEHLYQQGERTATLLGDVNVTNATTIAKGELVVTKAVEKDANGAYISGQELGTISGDGMLTVDAGENTIGGLNIKQLGTLNIKSGTYELAANANNADITTIGKTVVGSGATLSMASNVTLNSDVELAGTVSMDAGGLKGKLTLTGDATLAMSGKDTAIASSINGTDYTLTKTGSGLLKLEHGVVQLKQLNVAAGNVQVGTQVTGLESIRLVGGSTLAFDWYGGMKYDDVYNTEVVMGAGSTIKLVNGEGTVAADVKLNDGWGAFIQGAYGGSACGIYGTISAEGGKRTLTLRNVQGHQWTLASAISDGSGVVALNTDKSVGTDPHVLISGNNSYSGGTLLEFGTITTSHANALGTGVVSLGGYGSDSDGKLLLNKNLTVAAIASTAVNGVSTTAGTLSLNNKTLTVGAYDYAKDAVYAGSFNNSLIGSVTKIGTNKQEFTSATAKVRDVSVQGGSLVFSNTAAQIVGDIEIGTESGAGSLTMAGSYTLDSNRTLSILSTEQSTLGGLTLNGGVMALLFDEKATADTVALMVTGAVQNGSMTLLLNGLMPTATGEYLLVGGDFSNVGAGGISIAVNDASAQQLYAARSGEETPELYTSVKTTADGLYLVLSEEAPITSTNIWAPTEAGVDDVWSTTSFSRYDASGLAEGAIFDASAIDKSVRVTENVSVSSMSISGGGYSFSGEGQISLSGSLDVSGGNASIIDKIDFSGGTITVDGSELTIVQLSPIKPAAPPIQLTNAAKLTIGSADYRYGSFSGQVTGDAGSELHLYTTQVSGTYWQQDGTIQLLAGSTVKDVYIHGDLALNIIVGSQGSIGDKFTNVQGANLHMDAGSQLVVRANEPSDNPLTPTSGNIVLSGDLNIVVYQPVTTNTIISSHFTQEDNATTKLIKKQTLEANGKDATGHITLSGSIDVDAIEVQAGTLNLTGSSIASGAYSVASGATLQFSGAADMAAATSALLGTTGEGNIAISGQGRDATTLKLAAGSVSSASGALSLSALTLDMYGDNKTDTYNLSSYTSMNWNDVTVKYHGQNTTFKNVTVGSLGASLIVQDMNGDDIAASHAITFDGLTTLNGAFSITSSGWKYKAHIKELAGTGALSIGSANGRPAYVTVEKAANYAGNIAVSGASSRLILNNNAATSYGSTDATVTLSDGASLRMNGTGALTLNSKLVVSGGATSILRNESGAESMRRTLAAVEIGSGATLELQQENWNTFWAINDLSGAGNLTWQSTTTHWSASLLVLNGDGSDYTGTITLNKTNGVAERSHQAYIEIASNDAVKGATVSLSGVNNGVASLAINTENATMQGLTSNDIYAHLYAGASPNNVGSSDANNVYINSAKASTAANTLTIDGAETYEFKGTIGTGTAAETEHLNLAMTGEGSQTFSGVAHVGNVSVSNGTLALSNAGSQVYGDITVSGGTLDVDATYTLGADQTLSVLTGTANSVQLGGLTLSGGEMVFDASMLSGDTAALSVGSVSLSEGTTTQNITFNNDADLETGRYLLSGSWTALDGLTFTAGGFSNGSANVVMQDGKLYLDYVSDKFIWTGSADGNWNYSSQNWDNTPGNDADADAAFSAGKIAIFETDASVTVTEAVSANKLIVRDGATLTLTETADLTADAIELEAGTKLVVTPYENGGKKDFTETVLGTGSVELWLNNNYGNAVRLEGFDGELYVNSGWFDLYTSTAEHVAGSVTADDDSDNVAQLGTKLHVGQSVNMQLTSGKTVVMDADMVLSAGNHQIHHNGSAKLIVNGDVTGEGTWEHKGTTGTLTFSEIGSVTLGGFSTGSAGTISFNATTTLGTANLTQGTVTFANTTDIGTATISGGTVNFNGATTIASATMTGGTTTFANTADITTLTISGGTVKSTAASFGKVGGTITLAGRTLYLNLDGDSKAPLEPTYQTVYSTIVVNNAAATAESPSISIIRNDSSGESMHRTLHSVSIAANNTLELQQNNWNTIWHINDLSGAGNLKWTSSTNHWTASRLILKGDGSDYTGTITLNKTNENSSRAYQAYIEIASNDAVKGATMVLTGVNRGAASLAINTANATMQGLTGDNAYVHLYAGASPDNVGSSDADNVYINSAKASTANNTLTIAGSATYAYAGTVGKDGESAHLNLAMTGTGSQTFSGVAHVGDVMVSNGTLVLSNANSKVYGDITVSGGTLNFGGSYTLGANQVLSVLTGTADAVQLGGLTLEGGMLTFDAASLTADTAALNVGATVGAGGGATVTLDFSKMTGAMLTGTYMLAAGDWTGANLTYGGTDVVTLNATSNGLFLEYTNDSVYTWVAGAVDGEGAANNSWSAANWDLTPDADASNNLSFATGKDAIFNTNASVSVTDAVSAGTVSIMNGALVSLGMSGAESSFTAEELIVVDGKLTLGEQTNWNAITDITVKDKGTLVVSWGSGLTAESLLLQGGTIELRNGSDRGNHQHLDAAITVDGSGQIKGSSTGTSTVIRGSITGTGELSFSRLTDPGDANPITIDATMTDGANGALSINIGNADVVYSNAKRYTGGTTIGAGGSLTVNAGGSEGGLVGVVDVYGTLNLNEGDVTGWGSSNKTVSAINVYDGGYLHVAVAGEGKNQTGSGIAINLQGGNMTGISGSNFDLAYGGSTRGYSSITAMAAEDATAANPTVSTISGVQISLRQRVNKIDVQEHAVLNVSSVIAQKTDDYVNDDPAASGNMALTKTGLGELVLSGANTYTAATTVTAGTLTLAHAGALSSNVTVNEGALFRLEATSAKTFAKVISGAGAVEKTGAGTLTLTAVHTYTGDTAVKGGTLELSGAAGLAAESDIILSSGTTLLLNATNESAMTLGNAISGSGTLHKKGTHEAVLTGSVNVGTISLKDGDQQSTNAGTLTLTGDTVTANLLYAAYGTLNVGDGTDATFMQVGRMETGDTNTSAGNITLNVLAGSTLALTGNDNGSNYKVASIILGEWNHGTNLNVYGALLAADAKALVGDNVANITIADGGVMAVKGMGVASVKADKSQEIHVTLADGGTLILGDAGISTDKTFSGQLGAGTVGLSVAETTIAENLTLTSAEGTDFDTTQYTFVTNTVNEATGIERGAEAGVITLTGSITAAEGVDAKMNVKGNGTLKVAGAGSVATNVEVDAGATFELNANTQTMTFGQTISGAGSVKKSGSYDVTFTQDHSFTGTTTIEAGKLVLQIPGGGTQSDYGIYTLDGDVTGSGILQVNDYTDLQVNHADSTIETDVDLQQMAKLTFSVDGDYTMVGTISGGGNVYVNTEHKVTFNTAQTYTGETAIVRGTMELIGAGSLHEEGGGIYITDGARLLLNATDALTLHNSIYNSSLEGVLYEAVVHKAGAAEAVLAGTVQTDLIKVAGIGADGSDNNNADAGTLTLIGSGAVIKKLYVANGDVNIGNGKSDTFLQLEHLEVGDCEAATDVAVHVYQGSTLSVTGSNNGTETEGGYIGDEVHKNASFLVSEWGAKTTLTVEGKVLAHNAKLTMGDAKTTININGGTMAVQGISDVRDTKTGAGLNLSLTNDGKLILGADGLSTEQRATNIQLGKGTVGMTADMTLAEDMTLTSAEGTTFDTTQYEYHIDGEGAADSVNHKEADGSPVGGTMTVTGNISSAADVAAKMNVVGAGTLQLEGNADLSGGLEVEQGAMVQVGEVFMQSADGTAAATVDGPVRITQATDSAATAITGTGEGQTRIDNSLITIEQGASLTVESMLVSDSSHITGTPAAQTYATREGGSNIDVSQVKVVNTTIELSQNNAEVVVGEGGSTTTSITLGQLQAVGTSDASGALTLSGASNVMTVNSDAMSNLLVLNGSSFVVDFSYLLNAIQLKDVDFIYLSFDSDSVSYENLAGSTISATMDGHSIQAYFAGTGATAGVPNVGMYFDVSSIPEPTTTTLSLLALAALAARRRRK